MIVRQGLIALAVGAGGGGLDIFSLIYLFSFLSPSLWETARYRLKYRLKGPLNPKQPTTAVVSDRQSKGSKDELQLDNKFDILSDESEMEFVDTLDHSHITDTVSWSPILPPSP